MSTALQTCDDRITAALEYLAHETDPLRAITLAEQQLRQAVISLRMGRGLAPMLRVGDVALTFERAERVQRNPWPPAESGAPQSLREFRRVFGELPPFDGVEDAQQAEAGRSL